ncbi:hypothetical protein ACWEQ4_00830 [Rhodococcus sp. NPDC003994]
MSDFASWESILEVRTDGCGKAVILDGAGNVFRTVLDWGSSDTPAWMARRIADGCRELLEE